MMHSKAAFTIALLRASLARTSRSASRWRMNWPTRLPMPVRSAISSSSGSRTRELKNSITPVTSPYGGDRQRQRRVDVVARRLRSALLTGVHADVGHPQREAVLPDLARQPFTLRERRVARGQREADQRRARHVPEVDAADHLLVRVDPP